jgi:hypothetical protein
VAGLSLQETLRRSVIFFKEWQTRGNHPIVVTRADLVFDFGSATDTIVLPDSEPRAMRKHFIVPPIGSRKVARAQRPDIGPFEHFLQLLNLVNDPFNVHASQYPTFAR